MKFDGYICDICGALMYQFDSRLEVKKTEAYEQGRRDALNELMEYTYGMLTAEKFGLQHKIESMMDDTPQTDERSRR